MKVTIRCFRLIDGCDVVIATDEDGFSSSPSVDVVINSKDDLIKLWNDHSIAWWSVSDLDLPWFDRNSVNVITVTVMT